MKKVLLLEDDQTRIKSFVSLFQEKEWSSVIVYTAQAAIDALKNSKFDLIFLDHDLGGEQMVDSFNHNTGSEVARWIHENPVDCPVIVHSFNPFGAKVMVDLIPKSHYIPGVWKKDIFDKTFV